MFKDDECMTKNETSIARGIVIATIIIGITLSIALSGCASPQKAPERIDNTCPEYFKPLYRGCDTAYTELETEKVSLQAALERCNRTLNNNLSKSR